MSRAVLKFARRALLIERVMQRWRARQDWCWRAWSGQRGSQGWQLLVSFELSEALGGLAHRGAGPAQCHRGVLPIFHVAADLPDRPVHVFDDVRAGERTPQFETDVPPFRRSLIESLWMEINRLGAI